MTRRDFATGMVVARVEKGSDHSVYASLHMFDCGEVELAARETAAGPMVFEVRHGNAVEVELASAAHQRLVAKASSVW